MFLLFTPYSYIFLSFYFLVISVIFSVSNFFLFWLFIEILILLFIGISYTLFTHRYTQLILYFLFQTLGSFFVLVIYIFSIKYLLFFSLFLKLGIFPFFSWYVNVLYRFPSFLLFLARTLHKLPPMYIFFLVYRIEDVRFLFIFSALTILVSSFYIFTIFDLRYLLIVSSIGNNSFILLAVMSNNLMMFAIFYRVYFLNMLLLLLRFRNLTSHSYSYRIRFRVFGIYIFFLLLNLGSFPPFPGFFTKFLVFTCCYTIYRFNSHFLVIIMLVNVLIIVSYVNVFFKYILNVYSNSCYMIIF